MTRRKITSHMSNPTNEGISIEVMDKPGQGGASHEYVVSWDNADRTLCTLIRFQNGPIKEFGVNGLTQEVLLAIVIDRLQSFQAGAFANRFNAAALQHAQDSLACLLARTREREARGVEGTNQK